MEQPSSERYRARPRLATPMSRLEDQRPGSAPTRRAAANYWKKASRRPARVEEPLGARPSSEAGNFATYGYWRAQYEGDRSLQPIS